MSILTSCQNTFMDLTDPVGISNVSEHYAVSSSNSTPPTKWYDTPQTMTITNKYLWNYETITYSNNTTKDTDKRVIGVYGSTGKGISKVTNYYLATSSSSGITTSTSGWSEDAESQNVTPSKKYLWNYEKLTYTDNSIYSTDPCIIGAYGEKGDKGDRGTAGTTSNLLLDVYASTLKKVDAPADRYLSNSKNTNTTGAFVAASDLPDPNATHVYRVTSTDGKQRMLCWYASGHPPLLVGATYRLSCYAKANSGSPKLRFEINSVGHKTFDITDEWKRYEFTKTIPIYDSTPPDTYLRVYFGLGDSSNACELDLCGFRVEQVSDGIFGLAEHYAVSSSNTTAPSTWYDTPQTMTPTKKYLWNYETVTYADGTTKDTTKRVIGVYGNTGNPGVAGKGISAVTNYYLATASSSGVTTTTSGWTTTVQNVTSSKKYLWNYEKLTYTDSSTYSTDPCIIGAYGDTGTRGATWYAGTAISGGSSVSAKVFDNSGITSAIVGDVYLNTSTQDTYKCVKAGNAATAQWTYLSNIKGATGSPGGKGTDGKTAYFHVKYSNDGGKTFTGNSGEDPGTYIGTYTDNTSADSTSVSKYTWVKIEGEDGVSPTVSTSKSGATTTITIKDAQGIKTATVKDGDKGDKGDKGTSGMSANLLMDVYASTLTKIDAPADRYLSNSINTNTTGAFVAASDLPDPNATHLFRITSTDGKTRMLCWYAGTHPPLFTGATYRLSCYAKANSGNPKLRLFVNGVETKTVNTTSEWKRYELTVTVSEYDGTPDSNYLRVYFGLATSSGACELDMCGFRVEQVSEDILDIKDTASRALTSADGKNKVFYQKTAPTSGMKTNDVWFNTKKDKDHTMNVYDGTQWVLHKAGTTSISQGAITTDLLAANAVTADKILAGEIGTDQLAANAVTAAKINVKDLFAQNIEATGTIKGLTLEGAQIRGKQIDICNLPAGDYDVLEPRCSISTNTDTNSLVLEAKEGGSTNAKSIQINPYNIYIGSPKGGDIILAGETEFTETPYVLKGGVVYPIDACITGIYLDGVIETWRYEWHIGGRLRLTMKIPVNPAVKTALGNSYRSGYCYTPSDYKYPSSILDPNTDLDVAIKFSQVPVVQMTFTPTNNQGAFVWATDSGTTTTPPHCYLVRPTSSDSVQGWINIIVDGEWEYTNTE